MAKYLQLKAEKRKVLGHKVKQLRQQNLLPLNLYGKAVKSSALQSDHKSFLKVYQDVGETGLLEVLVVNQAPRVVLIQNVQKEPLYHRIIHADLRQVDLKEKLTASIPVVMEGEAPGVATGGILVQLLDEIEVEALPTDLPEKLTAKIISLKAIGDSISVEDLQYDKDKITLKIENLKTLVAKIEAPAKEEVEVKPEAPAEGEASAEGETAKPTEGQKPAEGVKPTESKPASENPKKEEKK